MQQANHNHDSYLSLLQGNKKFVEEKLAEDPDFFAKRAKGQQPKYLLIGCSDSRVPPDQVCINLFTSMHAEKLIFDTYCIAAYQDTTWWNFHSQKRCQRCTDNGYERHVGSTSKCDIVLFFLSLTSNDMFS